MAIKAFELFGDVELRTAKLRTGVRDADRQFKHLETSAKSAVKNVEYELTRLGRFKANFGQGFLGGFGLQRGEGAGALMGGAAANILQSGVKVVFGHVQDAFKRGFDFADQIQKNILQLEKAMGSRDKAVTHVRDLLKFGADAGLDANFLAGWSRQLQAVGVEAKEIQGIFRGIGGATGGDVFRMDKGLLAVYQMFSKRRLGAEEMNQQLAEAVPDPWGTLTRGLQRYGHKVDEAEVQKLAEQGRLNYKSALRIMLEQFNTERGDFLEEIASKTLGGKLQKKEATENFLYANALMGGNALGQPAGVYAERMRLTDTRIANLQGPEGRNIAKGLGETAGYYYWADNKVEKNAFKASPGRETIGKMFSDPKGAAADIWKGLTEGLNTGKGAVSDAVGSLSTSMWDTWEGFWETRSPSKRTIRLGKNVGDGFKQGLRESLEEIGKNPIVKAFFDAIKKAEGGSENIIVGGRRFSDLSDHPNIVGMRTSKGSSTAAGSWQITGTNWYGSKRTGPGLKNQLGLTDFTEHSQFLAALKLFADRDGGAGLRALLSGNIDKAMGVAAKDWTSTPGSTIGGGGQKSKSQWMGYFNAAMTSNGSPVTTSNPMPVAVISFPGLGGGVSAFTSQVRDPLGGASALFAGRRTQDPVSEIVEVTAAIEPLTSNMKDLAPAATLALRPLSDVGMVLKGIASAKGMLDKPGGTIEGQFGSAIESATAGKKKRDPLFDKAFTREGVAGDFHGGLQGFLANLGWEKPGSLAKQFGIGLLRDIQGRLAHDMSSMITGGLFGDRKEGGGLGGGLLQKLFGGLFGGFRAGGGSMSSGRLYIAGENGPEAVMGPGYVFNNRETRGMMSGGGEQRVIVYIGPEEIGRAVDHHRLTPRGRRAKIMQAKWGRKLQWVSYA